MKNRVILVVIAAVCIGIFGCSKENNNKDRSQAEDMFANICSLTKDYIKKLSEAPDSASWASVCSDYEEKLDKINFSFPPDTDLLLTEGQNDTIHTLMQEYVNMRDTRIHEILYPKVELDTLATSDSALVTETVTNDQVHASRNHGN